MILVPMARPGSGIQVCSIQTVGGRYLNRVDGDLMWVLVSRTGSDLTDRYGPFLVSRSDLFTSVVRVSADRQDIGRRFHFRLAALPKEKSRAWTDEGFVPGTSDYAPLTPRDLALTDPDIIASFDAELTACSVTAPAKG